MKGLTNMAFVIASSLLVTIGGLSLVLSYQAHSVIKGAQERAVVESINQMKFIEMGMEQAALYSVYQSVYSTSKYGAYGHGTCEDPAKLGMPTDFPYWSIFNKACFPEIENTIKPEVETKTHEIFNKEYIPAIKKEFGINMPSYNSEITLADETTLTMSTSGEIKFDSEKLKLSDKPDKIIKNIKLPLKRLIDFGVKNFVSPDSISSKIKSAKDSLSALSANGNLNGGTVTGNCPSMDFVACVHPDIEFTWPKKSEILASTNCKSEFENKIRNNIRDLESESNKKEGNTGVSLTINKLEVDTNDEIEDCPEKPEKSSPLCACIEWKCPSGSIRFGSTDSNEIVLQDADCRLDINGAPFVGKELQCPPGFPFERTENGQVICVSEVRGKACPTRLGCSDEGGVCQICFPGPPDICIPCSRECEAGTPHGDECWGNTQSKVLACPSNTREYSDTGRCYNIQTTSSVCSHFEDRYEKSCNYDYSATANVLINLKDKDNKNKYPIFDKNDQKTDFRNLELQFYVLSKN